MEGVQKLLVLYHPFVVEVDAIHQLVYLVIRQRGPVREAKGGMEGIGGKNNNKNNKNNMKNNKKWAGMGPTARMMEGGRRELEGESRGLEGRAEDSGSLCVGGGGCGCEMKEARKVEVRRGIRDGEVVVV